ncbi:MAG TPA: pyrroloquinoline quinone biosynthesis peptide chaperone PqqD [Polyangiales bacterium]
MNEPSATHYRIAPKARLIFDVARGKHMLIYPERGLELNEIGHAVLSMCDGQTSVTHMVERLAQRFGGANADVIARDVTQFLAQLTQRGVVLEEQRE